MGIAAKGLALFYNKQVDMPREFFSWANCSELMIEEKVFSVKVR
jgi:hypothetical protein